MVRRIGSLAFGPGDEPYEDTPSGRNSKLKRIRTRLWAFVSKRQTKEAVNSGNMAVIKEISNQLEEWDAIIHRVEGLVLAFRDPALQEWRRELEDKAERDRDKIEDQEIARWREGSIAALVIAIQMKTVKGFFGVIDTATDEYEIAQKHKELSLTKLHKESERMKETANV